MSHHHNTHPEERKHHHGPHTRHVDEGIAAPEMKHGHLHHGTMGGNHDHPRNWDQHSHPAASHLEKLAAKREAEEEAAEEKLLLEKAEQAEYKAKQAALRHEKELAEQLERDTWKWLDEIAAL